MGEHSDFWIAPFQRAKVVKTNDCHWLLGRELWVLIGPPERRRAFDIENKRAVSDDPSYTTHLYDDYGNPVHIGADQLELLARDERDFATYVECEYWKTWRGQG